jgi:hypothetical protein
VLSLARTSSDSSILARLWQRFSDLSRFRSEWRFNAHRRALNVINSLIGNAVDPDGRDLYRNWHAIPPQFRLGITCDPISGNNKGGALRGALSFGRGESRRAKLETLLRKAIEEAEEAGEPDIAEIVREALEELEHPRNNLEEHE